MKAYADDIIMAMSRKRRRNRSKLKQLQILGETILFTDQIKDLSSMLDTKMTLVETSTLRAEQAL